MTYIEAFEWCNKLVDAWKQYNFDQILDIFSDVEYYYEDPFCPPATTQQGVKELWEDIVYQEIKELSIYPIAVDGNIVIVRWYLDYMDRRTEEHFIRDGIYHVEFNARKKCVKFIQWWVMKE